MLTTPTSWWVSIRDLVGMVRLKKRETETRFLACFLVVFMTLFWLHLVNTPRISAFRIAPLFPPLFGFAAAGRNLQIFFSLSLSSHFFLFSLAACLEHTHSFALSLSHTNIHKCTNTHTGTHTNTQVLQQLMGNVVRLPSPPRALSVSRASWVRPKLK